MSVPSRNVNPLSNGVFRRSDQEHVGRRGGRWDGGESRGGEQLQQLLCCPIKAARARKPPQIKVTCLRSVLTIRGLWVTF